MAYMLFANVIDKMAIIFSLNIDPYLVQYRSYFNKMRSLIRYRIIKPNVKKPKIQKAEKIIGRK